MTIVRWDSSPDVAALQEGMSRMLEGFYSRPQEDLNRGAWVPAVDIYSNGQHELVLKAELPDMKEEQIELTVEDNTLTLSGEKKLDTEVTEKQFHRIERRYGSFARTFALPPTVDAGKVSAQYKAGVLTVRLPLREEAKPRIKIAVVGVSHLARRRSLIASGDRRRRMTKGSIDDVGTAAAARRHPSAHPGRIHRDAWTSSDGATSTATVGPGSRRVRYGAECSRRRRIPDSQP